MKAVVMAGGEGTRLRPLTNLRPKPMVPIANQPVMEHIIGLVKHHGITDVVATLAFMPRVIEDYFGSGDEWGVNMSYALEDSPLGTAGSVKNAESLIGDDTFVVISGDALTDIDLTKVIAFHKAKGGPVTIALKAVPDPLDFGVVVTDDNGRIERFLEKPTWGQVFSDMINTGIYVMEPEVFKHIPADRPFDFSSELFPLLMDVGFELFGCPVEGYWCDVGSVESYIQAHRDILDGKAMVYIPGVSAREGLWVGEGSEVDPTAHIGSSVVIGRNVTIRAGASVGDYTVLGDNCVVSTNASVNHSIIWSDSFIGKQASVNGSVLCRKVDVRARARVEIGAVIGDEVLIGQGATVLSGVQIYPYKRVESAAILGESLIWRNTGARDLFGDSGISGLVGIDITPELGLKVSQAFGSLLPKGSHVVCSRDVSRASRMIKRAVVAGLNSAGCNVRDLRVASPAVNRFTTHDTRCVAGMHVCQSVADPQIVEIHFYDKTGLDIAPWEEKKVERLYARGEFRRAFLDEVGDIIYPPRAMEYYSAGLSYALEKSQLDDSWIKVVADLSYGVGAVILPQVVSGWHVNLLSFNPFSDAERTMASASEEEPDYGDILHGIELFGADFGVRFEPSAERIRLVTPSGRVLDGDTALHAMVDLWCRTDPTTLPIAVPLAASRVIETIAARTGHTVLRPGRSRRSLAALAVEHKIGFAGSTSGGFIFPEFLASYDGVMALGMLARMLATDGRSLDVVVDELPEFHKVEIEVSCPNDRKGAVMRAVTEYSSGMDADLTEGVRVAVEGGWALVLPHGSDPVVMVYAEGSDSGQAMALAEEWKSVVDAAATGG